MKKILLALIFAILYSAHALAAPVAISDQTDGVILSPDALIPSYDGAPYRSKLSDQLWHNIKSKGTKTTGAICDGTSNPASDFYANLTALQADYSVATATTQEIDEIVINQHLSDGTPIYIPEGTCLFNYEMTLSGENLKIRQHPNAILKASGAEYEQMIQCTDCTFDLENITVDMNHTVQNFLYLNGSSSFISGRMINFYGYNAGWEVTESTNLVAPVWINGKMSDLYFDGYKAHELTSVGDYIGGNNIGAARALVFTPSSSSSKIYAIIKGFYFDSTDSSAEELDAFNQNVNVIAPSRTIFYNPYLKITGELRRGLKIHSGDVTIYEPNFLQSESFVTAPSALATTNVGEKNLYLIDFAGSGEGSITIFGGYLDVRPYPTGYTSSSTSTASRVKAIGTEFFGGDYDYNRNDPEKEAIGTATAGTASTITLDAARSSSTSSFYNAATIEITAGTGVGQTATISSYVGSTHVATISGTWTTTPDNTSVYHIYKPSSGATIAFATGASDTGSGCENCLFTGNIVGFQARGNDSFVKDSQFVDQVKYPIYVNPSTLKDGCAVNDNTIVTVTSGRMNDSSGIIPVQNCSNIDVSGNVLKQRGNTNHRAQFITLRTAITMTGNAYNNSAPATSDSGAVSVVYKAAAVPARVWGNNGNIESYETVNTTSANNVTTGEDTLHTVTLRPQALSTTNSGIIIEGAGAFANNANAKTLKVYLGTGTPINISLTTAVAGSYDYQVQIWSTGSSTQVYKYKINYTGTTGNLASFGTGTLTQTDTGTLVVKSTGEGTATNDIVENLFTVKLAN